MNSSVPWEASVWTKVVEVMEFRLSNSVSNPKRWCCETATLNMPANLENWAVATGLEKGQFSFLSRRKTIPKNVQGESESEVAQSFPTLCDSMDCSPPGSSIHGIFQARVLEWVAISFYRGSSSPRDQTHVSCIAGRLFTVWTTKLSHNCIHFTH